MQEGIKGWRADRERPRHGLDDRTLFGYRKFARNMLAFFPKEQLAAEVGRADVRLFLDYLEMLVDFEGDEDDEVEH